MVGKCMQVPHICRQALHAAGMDARGNRILLSNILQAVTTMLYSDLGGWNFRQKIKEVELDSNKADQ